MAFAKKYARPVPYNLSPLDVETLRQELKKKKAKTSKGLDGVTLKDLRAQPDAVLQGYCQFFRHAEEHGE